jgi:thioredoxin 1
MRIYTLILLASIGLFIGCNNASESAPVEAIDFEEAPKNLTTRKYDAMVASEDLVLVDFHATWCKPCVKLAPKIEQLKQDYAGKLHVMKIDIDENEVLATQMGVNQIPNIRIYANGKEVFNKLGDQPEEVFRDALKPYLD